MLQEAAQESGSADPSGESGDAHSSIVARARRAPPGVSPGRPGPRDGTVAKTVAATEDCER
ncbi:hypothetical protein GCM10027572_25590 [Flexivirga lutea]